MSRLLSLARGYSFKAGFVASLLLLISASQAGPKVTTADIVGLVADSTSAAVPGAKVVLRNVATNEERTVLTDSAGNYLFTLLPVGHYSLRVENAGFKAWNVADIALAAADRLRLDVHLEVGQMEQSIEVTAQSPALQTDSSTVGTLVNEKGMQDLPVNGRNFVRLAQLAPGANEGEPAG